MTNNSFDTPAALLINDARKAFLETLLPTLIKTQGIRTALDIGCGVGHFSKYLMESGLQVTGVDGRLENVTEAQRRNPAITFKQNDVEDPSIIDALGPFDLVFCFGLLYHLENPFLAIRNLSLLTKNTLLIETVIAPTKSLAAFLYEEEYERNQALDYIALIPSELWFVKCLYRVGFPFVYATRKRPDHGDFRSSLIKKRRRTVLVASKVELSISSLRKFSEPKTNQHMWDVFGARHVPGSDQARRVLKSILSPDNSSRRREAR